MPYNLNLEVDRPLKTTDKFPFFPYHPKLYESGVLSYYQDICKVCNQQSHFILGNHYGESDIEVICIHSISSGKAVQEKLELYTEIFLFVMKYKEY